MDKKSSKKVYCFESIKFKKVLDLKISYILGNAFFINYRKCSDNNNKIFKAEGSIETLKVFGLTRSRS